MSVCTDTTGSSKYVDWRPPCKANLANRGMSDALVSFTATRGHKYKQKYGLGYVVMTSSPHPLLSSPPFLLPLPITPPSPLPATDYFNGYMNASFIRVPSILPVGPSPPFTRPWPNRRRVWHPYVHGIHPSMHGIHPPMHGIRPYMHGVRPRVASPVHAWHPGATFRV